MRLKSDTLFIWMPYLLWAVTALLLIAHVAGEPDTAPQAVPSDPAGEEEERPASADSLGLEMALLLPEPPSLQCEDTLQQVIRLKRYPTDPKDAQATYLLRTDRISDFRERFEGEADEALLGSLDFTSGGTLTQREGLLYSLVNEAHPQSNPILREWVSEVVRDSLSIECQAQMAIVTVAYRDTAQVQFPVRLFLQPGESPDGASVWYLRQAESPYFTYGEKEKPWYVDDMEPDLGFMGLANHTDRSAESLTGSDSYPGDGLACYLLLTSKGLIRYHYSDKTQFIFRIGRWQCLVEHVESFEHRRSGFLITRMVRDGKLLFENR